MVSIFSYILAQLKISAKLIRNFREIDVVIFLLSKTLIFPTLVAFFLHKKIIIIATGSDTGAVKSVYGGLLYGIGGAIFYNIVKILEESDYALADRIGIAMESESIISHFGLHKHKDKIFPFGAYFLDPNLDIKKRFQKEKILLDM